MVDIRPFHGFTYNSEKFQDLSPVIAPPFDVISQEERHQYISKSPFNIVNLTLGEVDNLGNPVEEFYTNAMEKWNSWRKNHILERINKPAIWRIDETYLSPSNQRLTRTGFISLIRLDSYSDSGVQRHERTHDKPKLDRLRLIENTHANLSPIFFIYLDQDNEATAFQEEYQPNLESHATLNQMGPIKIDISCTTDTKWIHRFCSHMNQSSVLIADGHHRYEAARSFHRNHNNDSSLDTSYTMGYFVPSSSKGLILFPTHRGIHAISKPDDNRFKKKLTNFFDIRTLHPISSEFPSMKFIYNQDDPVWIQIKPENYRNLQKNLNPSSLASFSVVIVEEIILKKILGLSSSEIAHRKNLSYYHNTNDCLNDVRDGILQMAFLLEPITIEDLFSVSYNGGILPQKSTFFYPKCPTGIVMHSLEKH